MSQFPKDPKKIKQRIRRYKRSMRKEYEEHNFISDGYGKRYLLGILYMLADDLEGALESFAWFAEMFPDDVGEPFHYLTWALALYRSGDIEEATFRLRQAMLSNLYVIPHLLGIEQDVLDIWHGSNWAEKDYVGYASPEIWALWDAPALTWAEATYTSAEFQRIRNRYIDIEKQLKTEPRGPRRSELVNTSSKLKFSRDV
jgi:tetratricopeptide (TPR) repeat protein